MGRRKGRPYGVVEVARHDRESAPPNIIAIAKKRVDPLLRNWKMMDYDIVRLVVSCYLQGCEDTATACANRFPNLVFGEPAEQPVPILEFEI